MEFQDYVDAVRDECDEDDVMADVKAEAAWVLGLEPDSDEWFMLMDI